MSPGHSTQHTLFGSPFHHIVLLGQPYSYLDHSRVQWEQVTLRKRIRPRFSWELSLSAWTHVKRPVISVKSAPRPSDQPADSKLTDASDNVGSIHVPACKNSCRSLMLPTKNFPDNPTGLYSLLRQSLVGVDEQRRKHAVGLNIMSGPVSSVIVL